jgi:peptidyl-dipeptidase A
MALGRVQRQGRPRRLQRRHWWKLREKYQGVAPPSARSDDAFDPGAKYHIPANTPYMRYFLAHVLQYQLYAGMCEASGHQGPLHECSFHGSKEAGDRLKGMLSLGASKPWPDALEAATGSRTMDASKIIAYYQPLMTWLETQNEGRECGW